MGTRRERRIPCTDCSEWKKTLELRDFRVLGCIPDSQDPEFCILSFDEPDVPATAATVTAAAPVLMTAGLPSAVAGSDTLTGRQRQTAQAIINLFETSEVLGNYSQVTIIAKDTGHLTFGRSQTTLGSGNLSLLLQRYCANPGARFGPRLGPYMPRVAQRDFSLDNELKLHNILRASADDPVMRDTQDIFFDELYWQPAVRAAQQMNLTSPLAIAVVYDSHVHGSWAAIRDHTIELSGKVSAKGERAWIAAYVATRRNWLATNERADLRATVYRMEAFQRLIEQGFWGLDLPLVVRDKEISVATLNGTPQGCYDGPQPGTRVLTIQSPLHRGLDVRLLQLGLSDRDIDIKADGVYGQTSFKRVKEYQFTKGLPATGAADIALIAQLTS
jgi:chitosanase